MQREDEYGFQGQFGLADLEVQRKRKWQAKQDLFRNMPNEQANIEMKFNLSERDFKNPPTGSPLYSLGWDR